MEKEIRSEDVLVASMDSIYPLIKESLENGKSVRLSPKGSSMLPMIRQGIDTVTLSPIDRPLKKYDIPLYLRDDGKYVLHRIVKAGEEYTCIGDNQFAKECGLRKEQMLAVVTSFTRGQKEYTVSDASYRVYCILWHNTRFARRLLRAVIRRLKRMF